MSHGSHDDPTGDAPDERSTEIGGSAATSRLSQVAVRTLAMILQLGVLFATFIAGLSMSGSQGVFWLLAILQAVVVLAVVVGRVFLWASDRRRPGAVLAVLLVPVASMALTVTLLLLADLLSGAG